MLIPTFRPFSLSTLFAERVDVNLNADLLGGFFVPALAWFAQMTLPYGPSGGARLGREARKVFELSENDYGTGERRSVLRPSKRTRPRRK